MSSIARIIPSRADEKSLVRRRVAASLLLFFAIPTATGGCRYAHSSQASTNAAVNASVSEEAALWMLKKARQELGGKPTGTTTPAPEEVQRTRVDTIILNVFSDRCGKTGMQSSLYGWGEGNSLSASLVSALSNLRKRLPAAACSQPPKVEVDIVSGACVAVEKPTAETNQIAAELLDPGADGLKIEEPGAVYYLAPSALIYRRVFDANPESQPAAQFLTNACLQVGLAPERWTAPGVKLWSFHTESFVEDSSGAHALRVVRGFIGGIPVDREHLIAAATLAGDYFIRAQRPDGSFYYYYNPLLDRADSNHNNIIRHEGAASALFDLYRVTGRGIYLAAAIKAVGFLKNRVKSLPSRGKRNFSAAPGIRAAAEDAAFITAAGEEDMTQLGANGLGLLVVVDEIKYQKKAGDDELARKLANMILLMQKKDGSFSTSYYVSGGGAEDLPSLYYPGEAMLGLMELYDMTKDKKLLEAVRRGADRLMRDEKQQRDLPPDAWFAQALEKLYSVTGERSYAEHAIDLAVSMVDSQYGAGAPEGYAGGIAPGIPRAVQSASRAEGVLAGYRLALQISDPRSGKLFAGLKSSAGFQMSQQFTADNSFFLPDASRAQGGIRESITSMRIRIDYVQHTISSLLALYSLAR